MKITMNQLKRIIKEEVEKEIYKEAEAVPGDKPKKWYSQTPRDLDPNKRPNIFPVDTVEPLEGGGRRLTFDSGRVETEDEDGRLHSYNDEPARSYPGGTKAWFRHGRQHRDNGPAVIHRSGRKAWYKNGRLIKEEP